MEPEAAVGEWQQEDWRLAPRLHVSSLPAEASQLIAVLMSPELEAIKQSHDLADQEAVDFAGRIQIGRAPRYLALFGSRDLRRARALRIDKGASGFISRHCGSEGPDLATHSTGAVAGGSRLLYLFTA